MGQNIEAAERQILAKPIAKIWHAKVSIEQHIAKAYRSGFRLLTNFQHKIPVLHPGRVTLRVSHVAYCNMAGAKGVSTGITWIT